MDDYLLSNTYVYDTTEIQPMLAAARPAVAAVISRFLIVKPEYLNSALGQLAESYGTMTNYLLRGLGMSRLAVAVLRARLVTGMPQREPGAATA